MFKFRPGGFDRALSFNLARTGALGLLLVLAVWLCGCASSGSRSGPNDRRFTFRQDTFSYRNDLVWLYYHDPETGEWRHKKREPKPDYTHRCFPVARSARQFFLHARFDPNLPRVDEQTYRRLIRQVTGTSPRRQLREEEKFVIPGYSNLFSFSQGQERLLKDECGGAWQSYFQRGHWRMIMPFFRRQQVKMAEQLTQAIRENRPAAIHLVRFPSLSINHAAVVYDVRESAEEILYSVYDPYDPEKPAVLTFNRKDRWFSYPSNDYFIGGRVNIYEIYSAWNY